MAQIVTITNPLTGQPAQVDQLEHTAQQIDDAIARALPGGDIDSLLNGKAPAGYGLGTKSKWLTSNDDLNNIYQGGFYYWYGSNVPANIPTGIKYAGMFVIARSSTEFVQIIYAMSGSLNYSNAELRRTAYNGVWYEWEWVNPPMALGVEYRTTERYKGKPVYCKLVNFGKLPNNTYKDVAHGISNLQYAISVSGDSNGENLIGNTYITYVNIGSTNIRIKTNADRSGVGATVLIKYTKTTD